MMTENKLKGISNEELIYEVVLAYVTLAINNNIVYYEDFMNDLADFMNPISANILIEIYYVTLSEADGMTIEERTFRNLAERIVVAYLEKEYNYDTNTIDVYIPQPIRKINIDIKYG